MKLTSYMERNGLDDSAMAEQLGVSSFAVKKWRYGERIPRPAQMSAIVSATHGQVTSSDFYEEHSAAEPAVKGGAARILEKDVRESAGLFRELMEPLITSACHSAVSAIHRTERASVWSSKPIQREDANGIRLLSAANLLMFPLPGGKLLGEAKRAEIEDSAQFYLKQSDDMAHKCRWLRLIAQSLPDNAVVKDVLSDTRLRELQEEVRNG